VCKDNSPLTGTPGPEPDTSDQDQEAFFYYEVERNMCVTLGYVDVTRSVMILAREGAESAAALLTPPLPPVQGQDSRAPAPCPNLLARQMVSTRRRTHTLPLLSACLSASLPL
jgi:hypothetical protein